MRTVVFLAELNNIETCTCDISNAYLNAHTTEKIVFNAGPEFEPFVHAGHLLIIKTEIYGLNSSGVRLHYRISDAMAELCFVPSMVGCDIWMRNKGYYYSYVDCYFYYLIVVHKGPDRVFDSIRVKGFTTMEMSASDYFLGVYFEHVKYPKINNNILTWGFKTYVKHMMDNFNNTLIFEPSRKHSAIPPGYTHELDTTELCNDTEKSQY